MYLIYDIKTNKVVQTNNKPFVSYDKNRYQECYVENLPTKTHAQYFTVDNVREETKVIKEAYTQEEVFFNEETELDEVKVVEYPAVTETYLTCDLVVNDRPQMSEEAKTAYIAKQKERKYEELVNELIRKKYSMAQEFAILRQRDSKPEEFAEYNSYAEECKTQAKQQIFN